jgi:hypothetical protein
VVAREEKGALQAVQVLAPTRFYPVEQPESRKDDCRLEDGSE